MAITRAQVEQMAPDQASLSAARGLLKPNKWPTRARADELAWGECLGSGAAPYRMVVDLRDNGHRCTCPSRKLPCKHLLALLWQLADGAQGFSHTAAPQWVTEWSDKRREKAADRAAQGKEPPKPRPPAAGPEGRPSLALAEGSDRDAPVDPKAAARATAAAERLSRLREESVLDGLDQLERWLLDHLDAGFGALLPRLTEQTRLIARRLADAKAPALAGRLDQLAADTLALPPARRGPFLLEELGLIALLAQAWRRKALAPPALVDDMRRLLGWTLTKDELLADPDAVHADGSWVVLAARTELQVDGLQRLETWLLRTDGGPGPGAALLIDYQPVSVGKMVPALTAGEAFTGTLVFHPSATPLRAVLAQRGALGPIAQLPEGLPVAAALELVRSRRVANPWGRTTVLSVGASWLARDASGLLWLDDGEAALMVARRSVEAVGPLVGLDLGSVHGIFDGAAFEVATAATPIGRWWAA